MVRERKYVEKAAQNGRLSGSCDPCYSQFSPVSGRSWREAQSFAGMRFALHLDISISAVYSAHIGTAAAAAAGWVEV